MSCTLYQRVVMLLWNMCYCAVRVYETKDLACGIVILMALMFILKYSYCIWNTIISFELCLVNN